MTPLKYLFTVTYKDGSTYEQNAQDQSVTEPDKRSCFFDVKQDEVVTFTLTGEGHSYSVNLKTGEFIKDGLVEEDDCNHGMLDQLRLIFFRRHTHTFNQMEETSHTIEYNFGWQANDQDGKNHQHLMQL